MPLFTASSPYDTDVERATSELNAEDNVILFREIADKIRHAPTPGPKDCLRSIVKRINDKNPHVALQALSLLDTCVQRSGYFFHLEMATPDFISECRTLIGSGKPHPKVVKKLKFLIKRWAENEFKTDKSLSVIVSLYTGLKNEGHKFNFDDTSVPTTVSSTTSNASKREQDDLEKAIALSLRESHGGSKAGSQSSSLYPSASGGGGFYPSITSSTSGPREPRKVRALYDFEAAEDNELTFKAGEIIGVLDDSDINWWKGISWRGEGLFPANFVTADLTIEPEPETYKQRKSVHFHDEVEVKVLEPSVPVLEIDEEKIDSALSLIQNSDPTEPESDSTELLGLEEQCKDMGPLIDQELVRIDREHNSLMDSNTKLMEAFQMYHSLMRDLPSYGYLSSNTSMYANQPYGAAGGVASLASFSSNQNMPSAGHQSAIAAGGYGGTHNTNNSSSVSMNESQHVYHQNQNFVASQQHINAPTPPPTLQQSAPTAIGQQQYVDSMYAANHTMGYMPAAPSGTVIQSVNYTSSIQQPITAQSLL